MMQTDSCLEVDLMVDAASELDRRQIFAVTEEEKAAIEAGDLQRYLALLSDDAVFMPQNVHTKSGDELRRWLAEFLERVTIEYHDFAHRETIIRGDLAYHAYTCSWTAAPKSGGEPTWLYFKGVHVLRKQAGGPWKIFRSIWNTDPVPGGS
jgi:ketosteroid isomerase-like protein